MTFYETITAAIADIEAHGYDSQQRIEGWIEKIKQSAEASLTPEHVLQLELNRTMTAIYTRLIERGGVMKAHKGLSRFQIERLKPKLRNELERRIMASAQLIKLNRSAMIDKTIQRFSGWSTSIPPGGTDVLNTMAVKGHIKKALKDLPFTERRVMIDQGHKFVSELNNIIAVDGGAIAAEWHSHWRQPGYNYDPDHKELDMHVFVIRGNWAINVGFMNKGDGYTDDMIRPAERPFCRCQYRYIYALRDLPDAMLTNKGREELAKVRELV